MALPSHLAKYDGLIDLLVEMLVREMHRQPPDLARPATVAGSAGSQVKQTRQEGKRAHAHTKGPGGANKG